MSAPDEVPTFEEVELAIVGGGPAGAAAAITAARGGARVAVVDRARFPRDKCCGDGLTTAALRDLERLGLDPRRLPSFTSASELVLRSASGRSAVLPLGGGKGLAAAVCRRVDLDAALVEVARGAGAAITEGDAFEALSADGDAVVLELASGRRIRAGALVAADGAWSAVRRALPGGEAVRAAPQHWHAYRAYYEGVSDAARRQLLVAFADELLPGYAWSFPLGDGAANVGVCLARATRRPGRELAHLTEETLAGEALSAFLGPAAHRAGPLRSWPIPAPIGSLPLSALDGRALFVGDAARAGDPFSGEGIAQALATGIAAAEALIAGGPAGAAARYEATVRQTLGDDQRIASTCNALMQHRPASRAAVELARASRRVARAMGRWLYEDYPRATVLHPSRWGAMRRRPLPFS